MPHYQFANVSGTASNRTLLVIATLQAGASEPVAITSLVLAATRSLSEAAKLVLQRVASEFGISTTVNGEKTTTRSPTSTADIINAYTSSAGHPTLTGNPVIIFGGSISAASNLGRFWHVYNPRYPIIVNQGTDYTIQVTETFTTWSLGAWGWNEPAIALPRAARPLRRRGRRRGYYPVYSANTPGDISAVPNERNNYSQILWLQPRDWDLTFGVGSMALPYIPTSQAYTATITTAPTAQTSLATKRTVPALLNTSISATTLAARLASIHGTITTLPAPTTTLQTLRTVPESLATLGTAQTTVQTQATYQRALLALPVAQTLVQYLRTVPVSLSSEVVSSVVIAVEQQLQRAITTLPNPSTLVATLRTVFTNLSTQPLSSVLTVGQQALQRTGMTFAISTALVDQVSSYLRSVDTSPSVVTTLDRVLNALRGLVASPPSTTIVDRVITFLRAVQTVPVVQTNASAAIVTLRLVVTDVATVITVDRVLQALRSPTVTPISTTVVAAQQALLRSVQTVVAVLTTATGVLVTIRTGQTFGTATTAIDRQLNALRTLLATPAPATSVTLQQAIQRVLTTSVAPATTAIRQLARSLFTTPSSDVRADRRLDAQRSSTTSPASTATSTAIRIAPRDVQTSVTPQTPAPDLLTRVQRALVAITHPSTLVEMITSAITTATSPGYYVRGGQPRRRTIVTRPPVVRRVPVLPVQRRLAPVLIKTQLPAPALSVVRQLPVTVLTFVQTVLQKARSTATNAAQPLPIVQQGDDPEALAALGIADSIAQSDQETDTDTFTALDL